MHSVFLTDLQLLSSLFGRETSSLIIYDPLFRLQSPGSAGGQIVHHVEALWPLLTSESCLISLAAQPLISDLTNRDFEVLIDFAKAEKPVGNLFQTYLIFPNRDGSIRWLSPRGNRHASFLNLYNGSGLKSWLYRSFYRLAFQLGMGSMSSTGEITIYAAAEWPLRRFGIEDGAVCYSIFTGTIGSDRKVLLEENHKGKTQQFIKIPTGPKSRRLVANEYNILSELVLLGLQQWVIPAVQNRGGGLVLSNVRPAKYQNASVLQSAHLSAIKEMYLKTGQEKSLGDLEVYQSIGKQLGLLHFLDFADTELNREKVERLVIQLDQQFHWMDEHSLCTVALAHGDFTPWNMFVSPTRLFVYDWELARREMPLLYDIFHFIFQSSTLIHQQDGAMIQSKIKALADSDFIRNMNRQFGIDINWHWQFYLLYTASYYLPRYLQQPKLHLQAHWLLDNWCYCLEQPCQLQAAKDTATDFSYS